MLHGRKGVHRRRFLEALTAEDADHGPNSKTGRFGAVGIDPIALAGRYLAAVTEGLTAPFSLKFRSLVIVACSSHGGQKRGIWWNVMGHGSPFVGQEKCMAWC